jgi:hypothetical protein
VGLQPTGSTRGGACPGTPPRAPSPHHASSANRAFRQTPKPPVPDDRGPPDHRSPQSPTRAGSAPAGATVASRDPAPAVPADRPAPRTSTSPPSSRPPGRSEAQLVLGIIHTTKSRMTTKHSHPLRSCRRTCPRLEPGARLDARTASDADPSPALTGLAQAGEVDRDEPGDAALRHRDAEEAIDPRRRDAVMGDHQRRVPVVSAISPRRVLAMRWPAGTCAVARDAPPGRCDGVLDDTRR